MVKAMSGGIEPATLRRKTFSGHGLELVVSLLLCVWYNPVRKLVFTNGLHKFYCALDFM